MKKYFKHIFALAVAAAVMSLGCYAQIPVLMYHNSYESFSKNEADANIAPSVLEQHFAALKNAGFNAVSTDNYLEYTKGGYTLPENPIIITFDDGYTSNYSYAYPLLERYGLCATIFVVTGRMGSSDTMFPHFSWQQAREMEKSGVVSIYSHTDTHCKMDETTPAQLNLELRRSRYLIETHLGKPCRIIAAPNGAFNEEATQAMADAGYEMLMMVEDLNGSVNPKNLVTLKRIAVNGNMSAFELLKAIEESEY